MQSDKKSVMDKIGKVYNVFSKKINLFCGLILVCLTACVIIDLFTVPYCCALLERLFTYDTGNLIAVILVIWTFTATLVIFYLERLESRRYGIRMITIIRRSYNDSKLLLMAATFMAELLVLIFASVVSLEITLTVSSMIQFGTMIFVFLMVCIETSDYHFREIMNGEYHSVRYQETMNYKEVEKAYKELMIVRMIRNLDYSNYDNLEELEQVLHANPVNKNWTNIRRHINRKTTQLILESGNDSKGMTTIILNLFDYNEASLDDKKGILMALLESLSPQNLEICQILLSTEKKYQKALYVWCIVLNRFMEEFNDEKWRQSYFAFFFENIKNSIDENTEKLLWKCAEEINQDYEETDMSWIYDTLDYFIGGGEE